ncbi:MAG TPA: AMP-binding protein, partial [Acidimicrobiales bacterium]|nr:AMP-binding protein [Acidimicrobiales bacterium]
MLIGSVLADAAAVRPQGLAATYGEHALSFAGADRAANRLAHGLVGAGVRAGDTVAWWTGGDLRSLAGFFGAARLGAVLAALNPGCSEREAGETLAYLAPRLLVVDDDRQELARAAAGELG